MAGALKAIIRERIDEEGPLRFDAFMRLALYHAEHGYYAGNVERAGIEWLTSPTLTPLFGRTLAHGLHPLLADLDRPRLVEVGAGGGYLLADLVLELHAIDPGLVERLDVVAVESSPAWRPRIAEHLEARGILDIEVADAVPSELDGVVLSNELVDAMPVRSFTRTAAGWTELAADWDSDLGRAVPVQVPVVNDDEDAWLPDRAHVPPGHVVEVSPAARAWATDVASRVRQGAVLTIDYGATAKELANEAPNGTLHGYADGLRVDDVLASPGRIDITALVDMSALATAFEAGGAEVAAYCDQGALLDGLGLRQHVDGPEAVLEAKKLIDPAGAGGTFKALLCTHGRACPEHWPGRSCRPA